MRDKLVKTGHKKGYYRFRAFLFAFLLLAGLGASATLPIYVTYQVSVQAAHAQEEQQEDSSLELPSIAVEE